MPGLLNLNIEDQPLGLPFTEFSDNAFIQNNNLPWPVSSSSITASFSTTGAIGAQINLAPFFEKWYNEARSGGVDTSKGPIKMTTLTWKDQFGTTHSNVGLYYTVSYDHTRPNGIFIQLSSDGGQIPFISSGYGWIDYDLYVTPSNNIMGYIINHTNYQTGLENFQSFGFTFCGELTVAGLGRGGYYDRRTTENGQTVSHVTDYTTTNLGGSYGAVSPELSTSLYIRNNLMHGCGINIVNQVSFPAKQGDDEIDLTPYPDDWDDYTDPSQDMPNAKDENEPASIEALPSSSMVNCGFIKAYVMSAAQLHDLSDYMLSDTFLNGVKKLITNPIDYIISLHMLPCTPSYGTARNVYVGGMDSQVSGYPINSDYVTVDMGTIDCAEMFHSFLDYAPTTKISIGLPFLGIQQLNTEDVMAGRLHLTYNINVITGECLAQLEVTNNHMLTNTVIGVWGGSVMQTIPITARDKDAQLGATLQAGTAIGIAAAVGSAPAALGAVASCVGAAMTKPGVSRSGNVSGAAGMMGKFTPYIIKERPVTAIPSNFKNLRGYASCIGGKIKDFSGYLEVKDVNLSGIACTDAERSEILSLLKGGVFV